MQQKHCH